MEADAIGLDAEWAPTKGSPPALLQLATNEAAFLIDLITLGSSKVLGDALEAVLTAPSITKVGFDGASDLGRIAGRCSALKACGRPVSISDIRDMETSRRAKAGGVSKKQ